MSCGLGCVTDILKASGTANAEGEFTLILLSRDRSDLMVNEALCFDLVL